jgi:error-prone DNA polymerase
MFEIDARASGRHVYCGVCAHDWQDGQGRQPSSARDEAPGGRVSGHGSRVPAEARHSDTPRFSSLDALVSATGIRRDELNTLASLGALNAFGTDRRGALWEAERAVRPTGDLFTMLDEEAPPVRVGRAEVGRAGSPSRPYPRHTKIDPTPDSRLPTPDESPLSPMTPMERIVADYRGSGVTIGVHPMALRRADLRLRGVLRSDELVRTRGGRRVRVAGAVITRQRPGTAKGMVFLTLEDEAGLANVIVRPDVFDRQRALVMRAPFLVVEGVVQQQEGVTSVRAERVMAFGDEQPRTPSHDFR